MNDINWDDLHVFFHVATTGGLSAAARATGLSAPTIGRRMRSLEETTGQTLFERSQTGYVLTPQGAQLFKKVRAMEAAATPVQDFVTAQAETPILRLSAGTATTAFLADKYAALVRPSDRFRVNFLTTEVVLDIGHRETDLGIRNHRAQAGNLASVKLGVIKFAPYRSWTAQSPDLLEWVGMDAAHARHPAAQWLNQQDVPICAMASSAATVRALVKAGAGIGVLPCMIADSDATLTRAGPIIEGLTETQHLTMHNDDRHRPPLRRLIERISKIYHDNAALLAGCRPMRA